MPNRLADSPSAYLRQHKDNPVDWFPWAGEAFEAAKREGKPVFLSIGYSSCHWCHVMAHESFEDEGIAELLNRSFVSVKVDREERPDVDEAYMTFVQLFIGRGGWPTSVFLTPDRMPIYGGTYWPREDRGNYLGFRSICEQIVEAWTGHRLEIESAASQNADALREALQAAPAEASPIRSGSMVDLIGSGIDALGAMFDRRHGGFGRSPKFPPHTSIELLLKACENERIDGARKERARDMALPTLTRVAMGGIHDHVGGGFHRYSTDERWLVPHFEKMLYDNALLLGDYARAAKQTGRSWYRTIADSIVSWLEREMTSPEGLFYSALDADSEGEEGKFYVWSWEELMEFPDAEGIASLYQCRPEGNYNDEATGTRSGLNILHLAREPDQQITDQLRPLLERRDRRVRPGLDDKAVIGWNGLAIASLVEAGRRDLAERAAWAVLEAERSAGALPHLAINGTPSGKGFLDDYAFFAQGLLALGGDFVPEARRLASEMVDRFADRQNGGFFSSSADHELLFGSTKPVLDQPLPSGNAIAARVLQAVGRSEEAWSTVRWAAGWMERAPHGTEALYTAALELGSEPAPGGTVELTVLLTARNRGVVQLSVAPAFHLNSNPAPAAWLIATEVRFGGAKGRATYPPGHDGRYSGLVEIPFELSESAEGFEVVVTYQACTQTECLAPAEIRKAVEPQR